MISRDYNYRKHHTNRIVKKRITQLPLTYKVYERMHGSIRNRYSEFPYIRFQNPEGIWFNYIGEYKPHYNEKTSLYKRRYYNKWKNKYHKKRSLAKEINIGEINDEIRERYYRCH